MAASHQRITEKLAQSGRTPKSAPAPEVKKQPLPAALLPAKIIYRDEKLSAGEDFKAENKKFYHEIRKVTRETDTEVESFFLKVNKDHSYMPEIEATNARFCRVLAPHHVPHTYALYDLAEKKFTAVLSQEIPDFKSIGDEPLEDVDIKIEFMKDKKISMDMMEELDKKHRILDEEVKRVERCIQKVITVKKRLRKELKDWKNKLAKPSLRKKTTPIATPRSAPSSLAIPVTPISAPIEEESHKNVRSEYKKYCDLDNEMFDALVKAEDDLHAFFNEMEHLDVKEEKEKAVKEAQKEEKEQKYQIPPVTAKEFENYRILKGLAIAITTSYIQKQDDLHRHNFSKFGFLIDQDMANWPLSSVYKLKSEGFMESKFFSRAPKEDQFKATQQDILNLPELKDADPHYWPSKYASRITPQETARAAAGYFGTPLSMNEFPGRDSELFRKLKDNRVFVYHKWATFAKYIMTNESIYKNIASESMRNDIDHNQEFLYVLMAKTQDVRIAELKSQLLDMSEFINFFVENSEKIANELVTDLTNDGVKFNREDIFKSRQEILEFVDAKIKTVTIDILNKVKEDVVREMDAYIPGYWSLGALTRNHIGEANEIKKMCTSLQPDPTKPEKINEAIRDLAKLVARVRERTPKDKGGFDSCIDNANKILIEAVAKLPPLPLRILPSTPIAGAVNISPTLSRVEVKH